MFGKKGKQQSGPAVREDQVRRIQRALDEEETAVESGQESSLRRARAAMAAAERNASRAEISEAHRRGPC